MTKITCPVCGAKIEDLGVGLTVPREHVYQYFEERLHAYSHWFNVRKYKGKNIQYCAICEGGCASTFNATTRVIYSYKNHGPQISLDLL